SDWWFLGGRAKRGTVLRHDRGVQISVAGTHEQRLEPGYERVDDLLLKRRAGRSVRADRSIHVVDHHLAVYLRVVDLSEVERELGAKGANAVGWTGQLLPIGMVVAVDDRVGRVRQVGEVLLPEEEPAADAVEIPLPLGEEALHDEPAVAPYPS